MWQFVAVGYEKHAPLVDVNAITTADAENAGDENRPERRVAQRDPGGNEARAIPASPSLSETRR